MKFLIHKNIKTTFLVVLLIKLFGLIIHLLSQLLFTEVKMQLMISLKQFLRNINIDKKLMKEYFNKNMIMSEEEEHLFQKSNSCWICKKIINNNNEENVRDHIHVTGKFRGAAHRNCNVNFPLTKNVL